MGDYGSVKYVRGLIPRWVRFTKPPSNQKCRGGTKYSAAAEKKLPRTVFLELMGPKQILSKVVTTPPADFLKRKGREK